MCIDCVWCYDVVGVAGMCVVAMMCCVICIIVRIRYVVRYGVAVECVACVGVCSVGAAVGVVGSIGYTAVCAHGVVIYYNANIGSIVVGVTRDYGVCDVVGHICVVYIGVVCVVTIDV